MRCRGREWNGLKSYAVVLAVLKAWVSRFHCRCLSSSVLRSIKSGTFFCIKVHSEFPSIGSGP